MHIQTFISTDNLFSEMELICCPGTCISLHGVIKDIHVHVCQCQWPLKEGLNVDMYLHVDSLYLCLNCNKLSLFLLNIMWKVV